MAATETVRLEIDGRTVDAPAGASLLAACRASGIEVPTLCWLEGVSAEAACGVCVVEVAGVSELVRACVAAVEEGMRVRTGGARILEARRVAVELALANHEGDCLSCARGDDCELRALATRLGARADRFPRTRPPAPPRDDRGAVSLDRGKCVLCGRCVAVCGESQSVYALDFAGRGEASRVAAFMDRPLSASACVECGQCALVCPTAAIMPRDDTRAARAFLDDPELVPVAVLAPSIRATVGRAFRGTDGRPAVVTPGRLAAALRRLGFRAVFDGRFGADIVAVEERAELAERMAVGGALPMLSSCSPAWVEFARRRAPQLSAHLSSCKSPQQALGALVKTRWAEETGVDPGAVRLVSFAPCVAKKSEAERGEGDGAAAWWKSERGAETPPFPDVDLALTARELVAMLRESGIDLPGLPEEPFDPPFDSASGSSTLFGAAGGVANAVAREGEFRGEPVSRARYRAVDGLRAAAAMLDAIEAGLAPWDFVEVMACPGGCVCGGGQLFRADGPEAAARIAALSAEDAAAGSGAPGSNPAIEAVYRDFLDFPLSPAALALLHVRRG